MQYWLLKSEPLFLSLVHDQQKKNRKKRVLRGMVSEIIKLANNLKK